MVRLTPVLETLHQAGALAGFPIVFTLLQIALVNAFLVAFNLIPLPPFDGGQIVLHLMPQDWAPRLAALRPYGFGIGLVLAVPVVWVALLPFDAFLNLLLQLGLAVSTGWSSG